MSAGPGPYSPIADEICERVGAKGVVLILVGPHGQTKDVHAVSFHDMEHFRRTPAMLRKLANDIEADLAQFHGAAGRA